ncbi:MAG: hypothetical protein AVDCRST_MAG86-3809 [uncultured Truepera sp.]|uniref:Uncharacterized protein n=1 Tax=uncultured Truepera sp. TaxID=543023 RepID=A0A6J4VWR9_9DEIN|nr:MAG: hypothetical protein AVDCRST_MAG86-3809 [uncultured Truepera sp.]
MTFKLELDPMPYSFYEGFIGIFLVGLRAPVFGSTGNDQT